MATTEKIDTVKYGQGGGWNAQTAADDQKYRTDLNANNAEIQRVQSIIANRSGAKMDTSVQDAYLRKLQGYNSALQPKEDPTKAITDSAAAMRDSSIQASTSNVNAAVANQVSALEKSYNQAVADGQISVNQAKADFEAQKKAIEAQAYQQAQVTNLAGEDRGIGNSQQFIGLMQGDQARENSLLNQNMTTRDKQIADITTRLNNIKLNKDLDITNANAQGAYKIAELTAQANNQYAQNMFGFNSQNYFNNQQQNFNVQNMATQQGYNQANMSTQQGYDLEKMKQGQAYQLEQMGVAFKNDLSKMKIGQQYDMEKISANFSNQLKAMAKQNGYDIAKMNKQFEHEEAQYTKAMKDESDKYDLAMARELAKYQPGTPEYSIRKAQMEDAKEQGLTELHTKALYDAQVNTIMETAKDMGYKPPANPGANASAGAKKAYEEQLKAYARYYNLINGKSNPADLMGSDTLIGGGFGSAGIGGNSIAAGEPVYNPASGSGVGGTGFGFDWTFGLGNKF